MQFCSGGLIRADRREKAEAHRIRVPAEGGGLKRQDDRDMRFGNLCGSLGEGGAGGYRKERPV